MTYFQDFTQSIDPIISHAAELLEDTTAQYKAGAITKDEYDELTGDILDYDQIVINITDMVEKQEIYDAFQKLIAIVGAISKL
jgi:hypothetical protein